MGIITLIAVLAATAAQAQGSISGSVADTSGSRIPGAAVTVFGQDFQKQAVTQADGCYSVTGLQPGRYVVRAVLPGFCPAERDNIVVATGRSAEANFTLLVAPLENPLWAELDARYYWQHADAVVYLRIEEPLETKQWPAPTCGSIACRPHRAEILSTAKRHPEAGPDGRHFMFLQDYVASGEAGYNTGDEFVAFLTWNASWRTFVRLGGPPSLFPVRDGRVVARSQKDRDITGPKVEDFIAKLKALPNVQAPQANISGRITDMQDGAVPGTRVTATSGSGYAVTVVTDGSGYYRITALAPGRYRVAARMGGFLTTRRDNVEVTNGETSTVDMRIAVAPTGEPVCCGVGADTGPGLVDAVHRADEIVYGRIEKVTERGYVPRGNDIVGLVPCFVHTITRLETVAGQAAGDGTFVTCTTRYEPGEHLVAFLSRSGWLQQPEPLACGLYMVPAKDGRVSWRPSGETDVDGMKVEDFLAKLRALVKESR
jgi:hypothetical protein